MIPVERALTFGARVFAWGRGAQDPSAGRTGACPGSRRPFPAGRLRNWIGVGSLALTLTTAGSGRAVAEPTSDQTGSASCHVSTTSECECSFAAIETTLTFSEAAGVLLIYYRNFPDERHAGLLEHLLLQCVGGSPPPASPAATATIETNLTSPASAPAKRSTKASEMRP